jgi:hypothetical protein
VPSFVPRDRLGRFGDFASGQAGQSRFGDAFHEALALDDPLGDIERDLVGDRLDGRGFGKHNAPGPRVLQEAVGAAVAAHRDMADRVDPQAWLQARRDGEVEQVDIGRRLGEDRREVGG